VEGVGLGERTKEKEDQRTKKRYERKKRDDERDEKTHLRNGRRTRQPHRRKSLRDAHPLGSFPNGSWRSNDLKRIRLPRSVGRNASHTPRVRICSSSSSSSSSSSLLPSPQLSVLVRSRSRRPFFVARSSRSFHPLVNRSRSRRTRSVGVARRNIHHFPLRSPFTRTSRPIPVPTTTTTILDPTLLAPDPSDTGGDARDGEG